MANIYGTSPSIDEFRWAQLHSGLNRVAPFDHGLVSGLVLSPAAGTRTVRLSAGWGVGPGVVIELTAQETVAYTAAESATRYDLVVLDCNWSGAGTATLTVIKGTAGTSPTFPPLQFTEPGVRYQIPVGEVRVRTGVTTPTAADVTTFSAVRADPAPYTLPLPSGWSSAPPPPALFRKGGRVDIWGHMTKTSAGQVGVGGEVSFGVVIPQPWRPRENLALPAYHSISTTSSSAHTLFVRKDGEILLYPIIDPIPQGANVRFNGSWNEA